MAWKRFGIKATVEVTVEAAGLESAKDLVFDALADALCGIQGTNEAWRVRVLDEGEGFETQAQEDAQFERCADCGQVGERTGHMTCQYPQDH